GVLGAAIGFVQKMGALLAFWFTGEAKRKKSVRPAGQLLAVATLDPGFTVFSNLRAFYTVPEFRSLLPLLELDFVGPLFTAVGQLEEAMESRDREIVLNTEHLALGVAVGCSWL